MIKVKKDTAATLKIGPFVDSTDFKTAEDGLTIQKADVRLSKNGGDFAAASADQGASDAGAAHDELGFYDISLNTTDTNTAGTLTMVIGKSGALTIWEQIEVQAALPYDSLVSGTDNLQVDAVQLNGTSLTGRDIGASVLLSSGTGTGQVSLSSGTVTVGTNNDKTGYTASTVSDKTGYSLAADQQVDVTKWKGATAPAMTGDAFARLGAPAGASVSADVAAVKSDTSGIKTQTDTLTFTGDRVNADVTGEQVTLGAIPQAVLAQFATDDTGETEAVAGSVAALAQGEGGSGSGDWTTTEKNQIRFRLGLDGTQGTPSTSTGTLPATYALVQGVTLTVTNPVASNGTISIVQGDSYDSSNLVIAGTYSAVDLSSPTSVTFYAVPKTDYDADEAMDEATGVTCTMVISGSTHTVTVPLTSTYTDALDTVPPDDKFNYVYQVVVVKSSKRYTLFQGALGVTRKVG